MPVPDPDPDDCNGHGTHVSGIAGAGGVLNGVAPNVTFGAYRVFGCDGNTSADVILAALERALADRMDVVNMSIGSAFQWPQYPTAQASDRLVRRGVVVVASAGNSGANGLYATSAPALGQDVISVASFNNTHLNLAVFTITPDNRAIGYSQASGAEPAPTAGTFPMARTGTVASANDACDAVAPAPGSLTGRVALIRRGTCTFHEKARNAQTAGAAGVVIYNNVAGLQNITVAGPVPITIPVVSITAADGGIIDARLAAGPVTMTWTIQTLSLPQTTGNLISAFSSYGVSPDLVIKPDIGAPGGNIRSTIPLENGAYGQNSGTSMSAPHVAGAVALLLEAHPDTRAEDVRSILQNTADPRLWFGNPALGLLEVVHRQGAGMLDIPGAALATTRIVPGKLSLGESQSGPVTRTLTIQNHGPAPATYNLSKVDALATGPNTFTPAFFNAPATVTFGATTITVPAHEHAQVNVTIEPSAALADRSLYGGYIVFTRQSDGQLYRVPFAGLKGDYQSIQAIVPTPAGLPSLARLSGTTFVNQPAGATFTLEGDDIPWFLIHLDHQVRRLRFEILDASSGQPVHPVFHHAIDLEYFARNSTATSFFAFAWDGERIHSNGSNGQGNQHDLTKTVPNGSYVIVIRALKALGDPGNDAHWESRTLPVVTLARP